MIIKEIDKTMTWNKTEANKATQRDLVKEIQMEERGHKSIAQE